MNPVLAVIIALFGASAVFFAAVLLVPQSSKLEINGFSAAPVLMAVAITVIAATMLH